MKRRQTRIAAPLLALVLAPVGLGSLLAFTLASLSACGRHEVKEAGALFGLDLTSDIKPSDAQAERNAFLMISKAALEEIISVPVNDRRTIVDEVSGVTIEANANTQGKVTIELVPSDISARLLAITDAETHIDISGVYLPRPDIRIELAGSSDVTTQSVKPIQLGLSAARGEPVTSTFESELAVTSLDVTASGWFSGYKRQRAEEEAWATVNRELPNQRIAIGHKVATEIGKVVDERAGEFMLKFNASLVRSFRKWFIEDGYFPGTQVIQTTKEAMWFSSADGASSAAISAPTNTESLTGKVHAPLMIGVSAAAMEHAAEKALSGKVIPAAGLSQLFVALGASAVPPVWSTFKYAAVNLEFTKIKPITVKISEGRIILTANFASISQTFSRQAGTSLELTYEVHMSDDQSIEFVRVGEAVLKAARKVDDPSPLLVQFSDEVLKSCLNQKFAVPLPDLSAVASALKRMRLTFAHAEEGWIRLGASLDAIKE